MRELPPRQTEIIKVPATELQQDLHDSHLRIISQIIRKPYLTEMDFLRLQKHLLMCRLSANSSILVDKEGPNSSGKLNELRELLYSLLLEDDRKIILFSEWTNMLDLVEKELSQLGERWIRLDGSIPQAKRRHLVRSFTDDPAMRIFMTTNAGSTGLNLQAADTVINIDLPWNPALLEQRIGRAHRMGQTRPVQVFLLVTQNTIEERLLGLLGAKSALAQAALDQESDVDYVEMTTGIDALKNRLEILLGKTPDKALEEPSKREAEERMNQARREKLSEAGGKILSAVCEFLGELIPAPLPELNSEEKPKPAETEEKKDFSQSPGVAIMDFFKQCVHKDDEGRVKFTLTLPDDSILTKISDTISRFLTG
jgi:superfamily II DNA/RNA helicase